MTRGYELALIVDTQLAEDGAEQTVKRYQDFLAGAGAALVNVDRWGVRKLAYEIRKHPQGDYSFLQFQSEPQVIAELDRACRLDEAVLRHMVVSVPGGFEVAEEEEVEETPRAEEAEADVADEADADVEDAEAEDADGEEDQE